MTETALNELLALCERDLHRMRRRWQLRVDDVWAEIVAAVWAAGVKGITDPVAIVRAVEGHCRSVATRKARFNAVKACAAGAEAPARFLRWRSGWDRVAVQLAEPVNCFGDVEGQVVERLSAQQTLALAKAPVPGLLLAWTDPDARRQMSPAQLERCRRMRIALKGQLSVEDQCDAA